MGACFVGDDNGDPQCRMYIPINIACYHDTYRNSGYYNSNSNHSGTP